MVKILEEMILDILILAGGLALIILGGNYVTNGAVAVANKLRLPSMLVGLTIVALGSSTPDLAVSLVSTIHHKPSLAVGNVLGAVIFDMLLVIGLMAAFRPIKMESGVRRVDLPVMTLGAMLLMLCGVSHFIDHGGKDAITRTEAIALLLVFAVFMVYTIANSRKGYDPSKGECGACKPKSPSGRVMPMWVAAICIVGGLGALVAGGEFTVKGASAIARHAGMSEALIGITIVGIGSSLPDLATSLIAALKGESGLALGNIVGSCVMDILLVIGVCGSVMPLELAGISPVDFIVLASSAALLMIFGFSSRKINRTEGILLIMLYIVYMVYLVMSRH